MTLEMIYLEPKRIFEKSILGIAYLKSGQAAVVYDASLIVSALVESDGMTLNEAEDWFGYNIEHLKDKVGGPIFVHRDDP